MNYQLSDFLILKTIGEGAHGKISQVQYIPTKQYFSLKEINLIKLDFPDEEKQKKRERRYNKK